MKKLIYSSNLVLLLIFLSTASIHAQGTYDCYSSAAPNCGVKQPNNCDPDFQGSAAYCRGFTTISTCNAQTGIPCIPVSTGEIPIVPPSAPDFCSGNKGIVTAIGCVQILGTSFTPLATFLLTWGMGIGGGIAFMLIVYGGFLVITSTGNPQRLTAGKELITAAIMGLLMLIFSRLF